MIHPDRTFCIKVIDAEENLVEVLPTTSGALPGLRLRWSLLYLHDGDREDDPEYAVLMIDKVEGLNCPGREVGRIIPLSKDAPMREVRPGDEAGLPEHGLSPEVETEPE